MRFSIIIPVYNVEKYIGKCMETVMGQSFRDYEVIVVDDESPDNSMKIVEEYAERYPEQIRIIHQKNTRQGGARNRGVKNARGEYILFIDSDDYVSRDMLKTVDAHLRETPCDILSFRYEMVTPEGKHLGDGGAGGIQPGRYDPKVDKRIIMLPAGPVHKAYRREFYLDSGVQFPEKVLYEDAVVRLLYAKAESIVLVRDCLYYYVQSGNSSIRQKPSERMLDILTVTDLVLEQFKRDGLYDPFREHLDASLITSILYVTDMINGADVRSDLQKTLADYLRDNFADYASNRQLDEAQKKGIGYLLAYDFSGYHNRVLRVKQFKEWLLHWQLVAKLNEFRRRNLYK